MGRNLAGAAFHAAMPPLVPPPSLPQPGPQQALPADAPVLILLPGLTGGSENTYVQVRLCPLPLLSLLHRPAGQAGYSAARLPPAQPTPQTHAHTRAARGPGYGRDAAALA